MTEITRFSVSLEHDLLEKFDDYCRRERFATRSEAIRQLLRARLTEQAWESDSTEVAGTLTLLYDHHRPQLANRLAKAQHDNPGLIVSTLHAHLTHDLCLEVILLRGPAGELHKMASQLKGLKGIFKGELVMASGHMEGHEHPQGRTHGH